MIDMRTLIVAFYNFVNGPKMVLCVCVCVCALPTACLRIDHPIMAFAKTHPASLQITELKSHLFYPYNIVMKCNATSKHIINNVYRYLIFNACNNNFVHQILKIYF